MIIMLFLVYSKRIPRGLPRGLEEKFEKRMVFQGTLKKCRFDIMKEDDHIFKRHNKTLLLYHLVFPMKYRRKVLTSESGLTLVSICKEISSRYEVVFVEIGYESDHVHFLIQSIPSLCLSQIVRTIKSITGREMFRLHPEIKQFLWGGSIWTSGYYGNTVGEFGNKDVIRKYIENQGKEKEYKKIHNEQLKLFD